MGIVTGASRGLGMGIAQVLTNAGATVYNLDIIGRSDEKEITGNMIDIPADLTDREAVREIVDRIAADEGHLDFPDQQCGYHIQMPGRGISHGKVQTDPGREPGIHI